MGLLALSCKFHINNGHEEIIFCGSVLKFYYCLLSSSLLWKTKMLYNIKRNKTESPLLPVKDTKHTSELKFFEKSCGRERGYWVGEDRLKECGFKNSLLFSHFPSHHSPLCKNVIFYGKLYNILSKEVSWDFFSTESWPIRDKLVLDEYLENNFKNSYVQTVFFCQDTFILESNGSGQFFQASTTKVLNSLCVILRWTKLILQNYYCFN